MMFGRQDDQQPAANQDADSANNSGISAPAPVANPSAWQHPGLPMDAPTDTSTPAQNDAAVVAPSLPAPVDAPHSEVAANSDELMNIKQQALSQLSPLVSHLDQTPEEKFRTTMMMIQASDDQSLIHSAYEAAQTITDEKERAQALLDIINEINYFTQNKEQ